MSHKGDGCGLGGVGSRNGGEEGGAGGGKRGTHLVNLWKKKGRKVLID